MELQACRDPGEDRPVAIHGTAISDASLRASGKLGKSRVERERVTIEGAVAILGLAERTIQKMAQRGELPGAALMGRRWTFDIAKLRAYVRTKERAKWQPRKQATGQPQKTKREPGGSVDAVERLSEIIRGLREDARKRAVKRGS
ncbi:helix-turn-helix domain-containing protein [Bradyrhizobium japonicum]|uniref:helix-turn-helix domain-containing protein n=1 Tax=Bradyrhizobium japonicum TaxID=375 RepID=UPI001E3F9B6A|nr:helix-turn-helix domain-containing protein [Bradyrhizobium japonicum]MCD9821239.1 helix-turn-helix domain-containing protein [Bradyrhizobium japonicum]MEB2674065.1 helix-turn-helix domain-containing protein [Bradyrhizobium japonicum]WRI93251.1 helix-turn-helix domain-containing protein [Bradyrhizobium japonicum]